MNKKTSIHNDIDEHSEVQESPNNADIQDKIQNSVEYVLMQKLNSSLPRLKDILLSPNLLFEEKLQFLEGFIEENFQFTIENNKTEEHITGDKVSNTGTAVENVMVH